VEPPAKFELGIDLKAAKAFGLTTPAHDAVGGFSQ